MPLRETSHIGGFDMFEHWDKDITLYLRKELNKKVQWERYGFSHCFFKHIHSSEFDEKSRINGDSYIVRIPCSSFVPEITKNSIVVFGHINDEISEGASGNDILQKYGENAFRINTLSDNRAFCVSHIRIGN